MSDVPASSEQQEQRVARNEAMTGKGSYWELCRFDATCEAMRGILSMPTGLPHFMFDEQASAAVWTLWYGSQKSARSAAERALESKRAMNVNSAQTLGHFPHLYDLAGVSTWTSFAVATSEPGAFTLHGQPMMPLLQLMPVLESVIGAEQSMLIYQMAMGMPAQDLAASVEAEFPFMKQIHAAGAFKRSTSQHLLGIACLLRELRTMGDDPKGLAKGNLSRLLINIICRTLPDRIGNLVAVSSAEVASCFPYPVSFAGVTQAQIEPGADIWSKFELCTLDDTLHGLYSYEFPFYSHPELDRLVMKIDGLLLSSKSDEMIGLEANAIYQEFMGVLALSQHAQLQVFMADGGVFFAASPFEVPDDMVRPGFCLMIPRREREAAEALFVLIATAYAAGDISTLCDEVTTWRLKLEKIGKRIGASHKNVNKVQSIGRRTSAQLDEGRVWFVDEAMRLKPLVEAWGSFYDEFSTMKAASN